MSERFIQFVRSEQDPEGMFLLVNFPNAFLLLSLVAQRARFFPDHPDGLKPGECFIDWKSCGLTRSKYRTAIKILTLRKHIEIIETCRKRKKLTTGLTTVSTKVKLISSNVYDINIKEDSHRVNQRLATNKETKELLCLKETSKEKAEADGANVAAVSLFLSDKQEEELDAFEGYLSLIGVTIERPTLLRWLNKYGSKKLSEAISLLKDKIKSVENVGGWLETALQKNYAQKECNISRNREFAVQFKNKNSILNLKINKNYCVDINTKNDFQYNWEPEIFENILKQNFL